MSGIDPVQLAIWGGVLSVGAVGGVFFAFSTFVMRGLQLAALKVGSDEAAERWERYLREWGAWNHVRTISSLVACASFAASL